MASPPSHVQALLPDPSCLKLNSVEHQDGGRVLITAAAFSSVAYCPACHHASHSLQSRYSRPCTTCRGRHQPSNSVWRFAVFGGEPTTAPASPSQSCCRRFLPSTVERPSSAYWIPTSLLAGIGSMSTSNSNQCAQCAVADAGFRNSSGLPAGLQPLPRGSLPLPAATWTWLEVLGTTIALSSGRKNKQCPVSGVRPC
jgi:hypothetical protein